MSPTLHAARRPLPITEAAAEAGLNANMLYESVIELAGEGLLTAAAINAGATILLNDLGLPGYFFQHISKDALKRILYFISSNLHRRNKDYVLRGEVAEVQFDVEGGVQFRVATEETRDRMESLLGEVIGRRCVEYYYGRKRGYYSYIIHPDNCKELDELSEKEFPFAFARKPDDPRMPPETRERYKSFLKRARECPQHLVETTPSTASNETRIMFLDPFPRSPLPVVRKMLADLGLTLNRAYWEIYRSRMGRVASTCSLYLKKSSASALEKAVARLRAYLAIGQTTLEPLYLCGELAFDELLFAAMAHGFVHTFIYKDDRADSEIVNVLKRQDLRDAMARRLFDSNRAEYTRKNVHDSMVAHPKLIKQLFKIFDRKFNPRFKTRPSAARLAADLDAFKRKLRIVFMDDTTGHGVFAFMTRLVSNTHKTNFYKSEKRSFAFRLDNGVLDPLVFTQPVYGIFFVMGFYATATHMRAEDVARGGMRLVRVTPANYETELDNMPLLNYALGAVAQRLKHKDIAESGSKGVIVPHVYFANDGFDAVSDCTEGIMDLVLPSPEVIDGLGRPEIVFFGPDEGTAGYMDRIAERARVRGYKHWRTMTTGKTIGLPHDTYGLTRDGSVFGLLHSPEGTRLFLDGKNILTTSDSSQIRRKIGKNIEWSGMTTVSVMACFRTVLERLGLDEHKLNLVMTGGPDGDLGANQIQSFRGRICLVADGGSVLFDPKGLDKDELLNLALARHTDPRLNTLDYPTKKLSRHGFRVPRASGAFSLPDGGRVEDGALFHRNFLCDPSNRKRIQSANIQAFIPCGGFRNTINADNVSEFLGLFNELQVIVEGANVFFDNAARQTIAEKTDILQIRDSSANKGGVTCSSIAEVLTAFLLGNDYEKTLVQNSRVRTRLTAEVFDIVVSNARAETNALLDLHAATGRPLYMLSTETSEQIFALQARIVEHLSRLMSQSSLIHAVLKAYIPPVLVQRLGMKRIVKTLGSAELRPYRDAILTKKLAAIALYRHAAEWDNFLAVFEKDPLATLKQLVR